MHPAEGDYLAAKVFDAAADEVDGIVDYQKTVVHIGAMLQFYVRILGVVTAQVVVDLRMARVGIDCCLHTFGPLCENLQYALVHIVVNQNNSSCCLPNQIGNKRIIAVR